MQSISLYLLNSLEKPVPVLRRNCVLDLGPNALLWPGPGFQVASWSQQGCFSQEVLRSLWRWIWLSLRGKKTLPLHVGRLVVIEPQQHSPLRAKCYSCQCLRNFDFYQGLESNAHKCVWTAQGWRLQWMSSEGKHPTALAGPVKTKNNGRKLKAIT